MHQRTTALAATLLLAVAGSAHAAPSAVVFVNGIQNSFDDAIASLQLLKGSLQARKLDKGYVYGNAYNASNGFFADLQQVFRQKSQETQSARDFWRYVDGGAAQPGWMSQAMVDSYVKSFANEQQMTELPQHVGMYRRYLGEGRKVVLVAHSQGNLYANVGQNLLVGGPEKALGKVVTVGVASPAQYVLPQSSYVTSSWDQVINGLRVVKNVLPANASIGFHPISDLLGHSFAKIYLNKDYATSSTILQQVSQKAG